MRGLQARSFGISAISILCAAVSLATVGMPQDRAALPTTSEVAITFDPAQSRVHWTVDSALHTVHGTFELKSGTMSFDPLTGKAGGEIVVSALSGASGNGSRDKRMHKEILETAKFPDAVFHPTRIDGTISRTGASDVKLEGVLSIHGADHDIVAQVHAEMAGNHWTGTGNFEVPYVRWGIKDPSNFLLKVKPVVNVQLELSGEVASGK